MTERETVIKKLQEALDDAENNGNIYAQIRRPVVFDTLVLLKEQDGRKGWVSVTDDMPIELHSIFWPFFGTDKWRDVMWREQSDKVLVAVEFADGTRHVTTGETHDGEWRTSISPTLPHLVTHWMKMPDLPPRLIT